MHEGIDLEKVLDMRPLGWPLFFSDPLMSAAYFAKRLELAHKVSSMLLPLKILEEIILTQIIWIILNHPNHLIYAADLVQAMKEGGLAATFDGDGVINFHWLLKQNSIF